MIWPRSPLGLVSRQLAPPYRELRPLPAPGAAGPGLPRGAILVLDADPDADAGRLPEAVAAARRTFTSAPVVVRVPAWTPEAIRLAQRAVRLRVRAVLCEGEPLEAALRPILTRPDDLADDVVEWVSLRGCLDPVVAVLARQIVSEAERSAELRGVLAPLGEAERTARHRFRSRGLPPPSAWHQMARALRAALRVQAEPGARLSLLALDLGFSDHSGFSRQLTRTFGVTPAGVRGTLGWEWLVERWLHRRHCRDSSGNEGALRALSETVNHG
jgi:AraC-like DNA-binding protein